MGVESDGKEAEPAAASGTVAERWTEQAFSLVWGAGLILLLMVSWPLWQFASEIQDPDAFPRVGWLSINESVGWLIHWAGTGLLAIGLVGLAMAPFRADCRRGVSRTWAAIALGMGLLVVLDQHRLQPWAYQTILYALLLAGLPWFKARRWIMAIGISIYFYSAAGKFDSVFSVRCWR